jgi:hypothetical protein
MWLLLVPIGHRRDIICKRLIGTIGPPAQRLDGDAEILLETDGIQNVPAVQAPLGRPVFTPMLEYVAHVGRRVHSREAIGAAEIVFRARATDRRECAIAIEEELDLPLPKPTV